MFSKKNKISVITDGPSEAKIIYKDRSPKTPRITIFINNNLNQEQRDQQIQAQEQIQEQDQEAKQVNEREPGCLERLFCC